MSIKSFPVIDLVATGKNIVRLRKESGLSVADLQEYFGFEAPQAIYKWQKGQSLPSTDNLLALGHLLDVTMEEILVTRPTIIEIMPQEQSCGSHRFGDALKAVPSFIHHLRFSLFSFNYDNCIRLLRENYLNPAFFRNANLPPFRVRIPPTCQTGVIQPPVQ